MTSIKEKSKKRKNIDWAKLDPYIIENFKTMPYKEIAENLELNIQTLYAHIRQMRKEGKLGYKDRQAKKVRKAKGKNNVKLKISELDLNMKLGRKYKIDKTGSKDKFATKHFTGELIQITDRFYTFQGLYPESFLKSDFITGEYKIMEVQDEESM